MTDPLDRHVRSVIPATWARRLGHLAADTGLTRQELVREAVLVLLHRLGAGEGLPTPITSVAGHDTNGGAS